jgi:hypothetical protein
MKRLLATAVALAAITTGMIMYAPLPANAAWDASFSAKLVVESTYAAVAGVNVKAYTMTGGRVMAESVSGPDGVFTLTGLRGGEYRLNFSKRGYHDTTLVGVWVTPHSTDRLNTPIAMYPSNTKVPRITATNPCGKLVNPSQVADVYVVCTGE